MKPFISLFLLVVSCGITSPIQGAKPLYSPSDSIIVERYLREANHLPANTNDVLFFANKFIGKPYVAHTLEKGVEERLVVNLNQLDCTTYVEVVIALTLAARNGDTTFDRFLYYLQHLRYPNGVINGYASRNHYFSSWIFHNSQQHFVHEIQNSDCTSHHFSATQQLDCSYMTTHPDKYVALRNQPELISLIRQQEEALSDKKVHYIPNSHLGLDQRQLDCIHNGDILAIVTNKPGLDVSHLGFAVWKDGHLHLLNASSLYKKVVIDRNTLQKYNRQQKTHLGVRVLRIL